MEFVFAAMLGIATGIVTTLISIYIGRTMTKYRVLRHQCPPGIDLKVTINGDEVLAADSEHLAYMAKFGSEGEELELLGMMPDLGSLWDTNMPLITVTATYKEGRKGEW